MSQRLPDNEIQKLMKETLRGVAPQEHNNFIELSLVEAYQDGDQEAGLELVHLYKDVFSVIMSKPTKPPKRSKAMQRLWVSPNFQDYEDLFQEILLHFFILLEEYDKERRLDKFIRSHLHQRVFNKFFSELLETKKTECEFDDSQDQLLMDHMEEKKKIPSKHIELYQAIDKLGKRQKEVVELSIMKGWNATEVAHELGIAPATVRVTLKNSITKLRVIIQGEE